MEDPQSPVTPAEGQATTTPAGTSQAAPEGAGTGQAEGRNTDAGQAEGTRQAEESFFDYDRIKDNPDLVAAYKQMQAHYTKGRQEIGKAKAKIEAYDNFERDPVGTIQQIAGRMGYQLTRAEAKAMAQDAQGQQTGGAWTPQTWDEVMSKAEERAEARIMAKLAPMFETVQKTKAETIERQLTEIDPQWKLYEDDMRENLRNHPSLVSDPAKLYRLSVPDEVLEARASKKALKRIEGKVNAAHVAGSSQSVKSEAAEPDIRGMLRQDAFQAAVETAKRKLAAGGR